MTTTKTTPCSHLGCDSTSPYAAPWWCDEHYYSSDALEHRQRRDAPALAAGERLLEAYPALRVLRQRGTMMAPLHAVIQLGEYRQMRPDVSSADFLRWLYSDRLLGSDALYPPVAQALLESVPASGEQVLVAGGRGIAPGEWVVWSETRPNPNGGTAIHSLGLVDAAHADILGLCRADRSDMRIPDAGVRFQRTQRASRIEPLRGDRYAFGNLVSGGDTSVVGADECAGLLDAVAT